MAENKKKTGLGRGLSALLEDIASPPAADAPGVTRLAMARKALGKVVATPLAEADFAVLAEFAAPKKWSF